MQPPVQTPTAIEPESVEARRVSLEMLIRDRYQQYFRAVLRRVGNEADAADIIQEAFLIATLSLPKFRGESMLSSWVFGIAKNVVRAHRRKRLPFLLEDLMGGSDDPMAAQASASSMIDSGSYPDPLDSLLAREKLMHVGSALESLRPKTREALWITALSDADYGTLAHGLGVPIGTLKSRVSRGRSTVRASMKRAGLADG